MYSQFRKTYFIVGMDSLSSQLSNCYSQFYPSAISYMKYPFPLKQKTFFKKNNFDTYRNENEQFRMFRLDTASFCYVKHDVNMQYTNRSMHSLKINVLCTYF